MRRAARVLLAGALLWAPAAATAAEVDSATLRELAARAAAGDQAARDRLLEVDAVDGRPVDVAGLLAGAGADEAARLAVLAAAGDPFPGGPSAAEARRRAEEILGSARFGGDLEPRRSLSERIFQLVDDVAAWILPSGVGDSPGWVLAGIAVVALAVGLAVRAVRRRPPAVPRGLDGSPPAAAAEDPDELARAADAAGAAGDYAGEVRLRFRAGLLYLDRRRLLPFDPAMTTGRLARTLPGPAARGVADAFDAIVYGGRPATADDARAARLGWSEILGARS